MQSPFHDLPQEKFPFVVEAMDERRRIVWRTTVHEPGAMHVPPLARTYGPVSIRITYATGEVVEESPRRWS